jgi:2-oxoglutarate dehydrogenase E2 component (dihydrolipoamide succinyltransferase)
MKIEVIVPEVGESITSGILLTWLKSEGDYVEEGEELFEFETEKTTLAVPSDATGVLKILVPAETEINVGQVIAEIDSDAAKKEPVQESTPEEPGEKAVEETPQKASEVFGEAKPLSPAVRRLVEEHNLDVDVLQATGPKGNITKEDVLRAIEKKDIKSQAKKPEKQQVSKPALPSLQEAPEKQTRVRMSMIRKKIAENLVQSQKSAAHLTTFNEIDMSAVIALRTQYRDGFQEEFGVRLGFMSFFIKATQQALTMYPELNAFIEDEEIVYNHDYHIGVALSTEKGLMTPVIRNVERKSFAAIEKEIITFAQKVKEKKLLPQELMGGTFTITNGGVFGSLLSTPIPNPPQSGILGMHAIQKRPVVLEDEIVVRPMMYVALTYDHRIVDGREAVGFLVQIKRLIEDPNRLLLAL